MVFLVVDDSFSVARILQRQLKELGYEADIAASGKEALLSIEKREYDLVFMDQIMPEMDGLETFRQLRYRNSNHPPVIMVTAISDLNLVTEFMKAGGSDFLSKPVEATLLKLKIHQALDSKRVKQQLYEEKVGRLEAEAINLSKSNFLSNMSHELRTPIHGILNYSRMGIKKAEKALPAQHHKYYTKIIHCAERLDKLMDDLVNLATMEAGNMGYFFRVSRLSDAIQPVLNELQEMADTAKVRFHFQTPEFDDHLPFDRAQISRVIKNLVDNAIRYSKQDTTIFIEMEENPTQILVHIHDQGVGIPENELERVFEKFTQSSTTDTGAGGTGLGLSIARRIIMDHHGKIWCRNNPDGGCTFSFYLPRPN